MKGLGVFSPNPATSRCILVARGFDESFGVGSEKPDTDEKSLDLFGFKIKDRDETSFNPLSAQFENIQSLSTFGYDSSFLNVGGGFEEYIGSHPGSGIAEFSSFNTNPLDTVSDQLTTMKWVSCGSDSGMVVVGTATGDVILFSGESILDDSSPQHIVSKASVFSAPVRCLGYNSKNSMLGVAGVDGRLSVCDLSDPACPQVIDMGYGKWKVGLVTGLSWNSHLGHILATAGSCLGSSGTISPSDFTGLVIWDLKVRKPASSFRDPNGRMNPVSIEWVPGQLTQLIVGYGDDKSPAIQLWDLRNCSAPLKEIKGHTRGVTSLAFSPHDHNLLLSSGRDDFTRCWSMDHVNGPFYLVSSVQTAALSHHKRVEWHPHVPGLFLAQDTDDENSIHSIFCSLQSESYMPSWVRKQKGVISAFAGSVSTWDFEGDVKLYTLGNQFDSETHGMLEESLRMLCDLQDQSMFGAVCQKMISQAETEFDSLTWRVMEALHKNDKKLLVSTFGYSFHDPKIGSAGLDKKRPEDSGSETFGLGGEIQQDNAEEFFNSLREKDADIQCPVVAHQELSWGDSELRGKVVVGDFEAASDYCLEHKKKIEALLVAYAGGRDLWLRVAKSIVEESNDPFVRTIFFVMQGDLLSLVERGALDDWKEILSCLCSQSSELADYKELCGIFGDRLYESFSKGNKEHLLPASVSYMCNGNFAKVIEIWRHLERRRNALHILADSIVRMAALSIAIMHDFCDESIARSTVVLAEAFLDMGDLKKALDCLSLPCVSNSTYAISLKNRIQGVDTLNNRIQGVDALKSQGMDTLRETASFAPVGAPSLQASSAQSNHIAPKFQVQSSPSPCLQQTYSGVATAPGAVAGAMYPGMPVPWPIPTETQQKVSRTRSTEESNRRIVAASVAKHPMGEQMPRADLDFVTSVLQSLVSGGDQSRASEENRKRIGELITALGSAQLSKEGNDLLVSMCSAIRSGDRVSANITLASISTKLWDSRNKNWIMCLKRIVPR